MERKKICRYCQKEFIAKRIDAKYCSQSCRQMGYRRESSPEVYGKVVPVFFELDAEEYEQLLIKSGDEDIHPNDFAKEYLLRNEENYVKLYFQDREWPRYLNSLEHIFPDKSMEKLMHDWIIERIKKEFER